MKGMLSRIQLALLVLLFVVLALAAGGQVAVSRAGARSGTSGQKPLLSDDFDMAGSPRSSRWVTYRGKPRATKGMLELDGAEVQSKDGFRYGVLEGVVYSTDWISPDRFTDSSFGFEIWAGAKGQCHAGVVFKPSGHLGLLNATPDPDGNCTGDPVPGQEQAYVEISNWKAVCASGRVKFVLSWLPDKVLLQVSDGGSNQGEALYSGPVLPDKPLRVRLYAHTFASGQADHFKIDSISLRAAPGDPDAKP